MSRIATLSRRASRLWFRLVFCCLVPVALTTADRARAADDAPAKPAEKKIPDPEAIELVTDDGLLLEATYYGSLKGKDAVPIIMLHDWKGSGADFAGVAEAMQRLGHVVIVPDLRGHGKSTKFKAGGSIDQSLMKRPDFDAMVTQDLVAVNKYLIDKNNKAELNIEKLCVVGAGMGALVGMEWSVKDWSERQLLIGKQGQDVKALVLISPPMNFRGISITPPLDYLAKLDDPYLSVLIMFGGDKGGKGADVARKAADDAQRVYNKFASLRPKPPTDRDEIIKSKDLFNDSLMTSLQGTKILEDTKLEATAAKHIADFIELRLVNKKFPWAMRNSP